MRYEVQTRQDGSGDAWYGLERYDTREAASEAAEEEEAFDNLISDPAWEYRVVEVEG